MSIYSLSKNDIESFIDYNKIISVVENGFSAYNSGKSIVPPVTNLDIKKHKGEVHIKSSYIDGYENYCIKIASGFYNNSKIGLPTGYGIMLLYSVESGFLKALIFDEGLLTDLRTAAAGAIAAKYCSNENIESAGIIGTGVQARLQILFLKKVRKFQKLWVYGRNPEKANEYLNDISKKLPDVKVKICKSPAEVAQRSQILITATPAKEPLINKNDLHEGIHITAMGSDGPDKQEVNADVFSICDKIVADHKGQCLNLGEIHHAVEKGIINKNDIDAELGELILKGKNIRESEKQITICDLTGVAVQDLAISNWVLEKAINLKLGKEII